MTTDNPYSPLGYPLTNLPRPGKPVSSLLVRDTVPRCCTGRGPS